MFVGEFNMMILFFIIVLLVIFGFIKLRFKLKYCEKEGFNVVLRVVFLRFFLYSSNVYKKKKGLRKKEKKKKTKIKKKTKKKKRLKSLSEIVEIVEIFLRPAPTLLKFLNRGFKITNIKFKVKIASDDAKNTALMYANFIKVFYMVLGFISSYCKVIKKDIDIRLNFLEDKPAANFDIDFKVSIGRIFIGILIYLFLVFVGFINKGLIKKKRSV